MFEYKKITAICFALALFFGFTLSGFAQEAKPEAKPELKLGYVDTGRLKQEFKEFADTQEKFAKEMETYQVLADSFQREIFKLQEELQKKATVLNEAGKKELQKKIVDKQAELAKLVGSDGIAAKREKELSKPLIEKIDAVIRLLAIKEGYDFVFDSSGGLFLYAKEGYDLTDRVLEELNKK
jgi:outer membrane protein